MNIELFFGYVHNNLKHLISNTLCPKIQCKSKYGFNTCRQAIFQSKFPFLIQKHMISYISHNVITWINTFARNDNNFNNKLIILEIALGCCQGKIDKKKK